MNPGLCNISRGLGSFLTDHWPFTVHENPYKAFPQQDVNSLPKQSITKPSGITTLSYLSYIATISGKL